VLRLFTVSGILRIFENCSTGVRVVALVILAYIPTFGFDFRCQVPCVCHVVIMSAVSEFLRIICTAMRIDIVSDAWRWHRV